MDTERLLANFPNAERILSNIYITHKQYLFRNN